MCAVPVATTDSEVLDILETAELHRFADWPAREVPNGPGIYTVWRNADFLYVGVAGRIRLGQDPLLFKSLRGRLGSHASGRRSGDQFCVYVCDRLVLPALEGRLREISEGKLSLDALTRAFIRENLSFRFAVTPDFAAALRLETGIKRLGLKGSGRPFLNPGATLD